MDYKQHIGGTNFPWIVLFKIVDYYSLRLNGVSWF